MKKRILIIDDESYVRQVMRRILEKEGYEVLSAGDGEEALALLENEQVNLIMLDMNMPRMNGLEFLRAIRDRKMRTAPVLMVTGDSDNRIRMESYSLGVYDFISKPEEIEVLLKRVENGIKIDEVLAFNDSIRMELLIARKLQQALFPGTEYTGNSMDIWAGTYPLSDIGGDIYDFIEFRDGRVVFFVADVSGHGISAALFTAIVKMGFRNALKQTEDPGDIMTRINHDLVNNLPVESFVTMFCGMVDPCNGNLFYANAGHPLPFVVKGGKVTRLPGGEPFLGPLRDVNYTTYSIPLTDMDEMAVVTDGTLDVCDSAGNHIGERILSEVLENQGASGGRIGMFQERVKRQECHFIDDVTIMIFDLSRRKRG